MDNFQHLAHKEHKYKLLQFIYNWKIHAQNKSINR